jgi:hypothetical protein
LQWFPKWWKIPGWPSLISRYSNCQNICALFELILSISPSSAEAETGFTQLKLVKTSIRSSLGQVSE